MLDRDRADVAIDVHIQNGVLVQIPSLGDRLVPKLDVQGVRVSEVPNLHGLNPRSKNAL